jgi:hypothetical protein
LDCMPGIFSIQKKTRCSGCAFQKRRELMSLPVSSG